MPASSRTHRLLPRLLNQDEVAEILGVSTRTVRTLAARGDLRRIVLGRRSTRYRLDDVERYIRDHTLNEAPMPDPAPGPLKAAGEDGRHAAG